MVRCLFLSKENHEWRRGLCGICPAGCWVEVALQGGEIVGIRADTTHPLGMICKRGEHAPEIIYSDQRLKYPLKRVAPKGTTDNEAFERISWDQAYEIIAENLKKIKYESGPEATCIYTGRGAFELSLCDIFQPKGVAVSSASSVLFPFGSPNTMGVGALCYVSFAKIAPHVTMGRMYINMFTDIENADLLLIWGANPATDSPPSDMHRLEAAVERGVKIYAIDPRRSETAIRTNAEWVPIRPGTDGALALAMLEVVISEEVFDEDFVDNWTHGFGELRQYVQHFAPEVVETITGVPASKIREIALAVADTSSSAPVMYTGLEYSNTGLQAIRAVLTLFAITGSLDVPGGIGLMMAENQFPINKSCNQPNPDLSRAIARDRFPLYSHYRGESHAIGLVDSVLKEDPYKIKGLLIHGASITTSWPQTQVWEETLANLDFVACIDRQMTRDMRWADVVLPATTMFEVESYMTYGSYFRLREKIIEPVGEARNDYQIMHDLATKLGYGHLYPKPNEDLLRFVLEGSGFTLEEVRDAEGTVKVDTTMLEYKKWEKGKLRPDGQPGFDTPTGKFEIWSTILEDYGYEPLPKYTEVREGPLGSPELARSYPLVFNSGARTQVDFRSQHHSIDGLVRDNPEPTVELSQVDAEERDIKTGDLVEVRTMRGAVPFRARVSQDILEGSVECNMGGGTPCGPKAWQEWNVNLLTDLSNYDEISGFPVYKALLCEVRILEEGNEETAKAAVRKISFVEARGILPTDPTTVTTQKIYLDNNATTQVDPEVRDSMLPFLGVMHGNPSSIHAVGQEAKKAISTARRQLANFLNCHPKNIVFTGGGSEADNLALKGIVFRYTDKGKHIITSSVEHPAILKTCKFLERLGYRVTYLGVDQHGMIQPSELREAITDDTLLVSIMMANNEVGTIQPIKELCSITHERGAFFHTDAVQAGGKIQIDVEELGVDLLTLSGHKFHGPKGVGILYVRKGVDLEPLVHGGSQEGGLRAGTENVPAMVGIGKAAELAQLRLTTYHRITHLRDLLQEQIIELVPNAQTNGHPMFRLPNTLNMTLPRMRGESLVIALDRRGISISSGSACKAGSPEPTHVLLAMGKNEEEAHCTIRISLAHNTTKEDIDKVVTALRDIIEELSTSVRFLPCK